MKHLLIAFLLFCSISSAQNVVFPLDSTGMVCYDTIMQCKGAKIDIHKRANMWVVQQFSSAIDVIQLNDTASGVIVVKGISAAYTKGLSVMQSGYNHFTINIWSKDGKVKFSINHIVWHADYANVHSIEETIDKGRFWNTYRTYTDKDMRELRASFVSYMNTEQKNDW